METLILVTQIIVAALFQLAPSELVMHSAATQVSFWLLPPRHNPLPKPKMVIPVCANMFDVDCWS